MKKYRVILIAAQCFFFSSLYSIDNVTTFKSNKVVANSVIVFTQPALAKTNLMDKKSAYSVQVKNKIPDMGIEEWTVSGDLETILKDLNSIPGVSAIPNYVFERSPFEASLLDAPINPASSIPNDPFLGDQWSLNNDGTFEDLAVPGADISAFQAWEVTTGNPDVVVAVFDGGIDITHEDLADHIWFNPAEIPDNQIDDDGNGFVDDIHGWNAVGNNNDILDRTGHGTHVAGTIGAVTNNGIGVAGVSQHVKLLAVKIFNDFGGSTMIGFIRGYHYLSTLLKQGVNLVAVNQSWGGIRFMDYPSQRKFIELMTSFALEHHELGMLWVLSAGNDAADNLSYPYYLVPNNIQSPNIIVVGSTNSSDESSSFTNFNPKAVDIGAPGSIILSTFPHNQYAYGSGTSMAAPHVTGVLALAKSAFPAENDLALFSRVQATCDVFAEFNSLWMNGGRLNAHLAVTPDQGFAGLKTNVEKLYLNYSHYDNFAAQTVGFVNGSGNPVTVLDIHFTGEDASAFSLYHPFSTSSVANNGAYGIGIQFKSDGTKPVYNANVVISTNGGNLSIPLVGELIGSSDIAIDPESIDLGNVKYGDVLSTSYTIQNNGSKDLDYTIQRDIFWFNEPSTENLASQVSYKKSTAFHTKEPFDFKQGIVNKLEKLGTSLGDTKRKHVDLVQADTPEDELRELWSDDLNDAARVAEDWIILNEGTGNEWELFDIDPSPAVDNIFLAGDFELGYQNVTATGALSPVFNFSQLSENKEAPKFLQFDYAGLLEDGYDYMVLAVFMGDILLGFLFDSDFDAVNDGSVYTITSEIDVLSGMDDISFMFAAFYDSTVVAGWGCMFDNVKILVGEDPIQFSNLGGSIPAGGSQQIDATIKTNLLREGDYYVISAILSNASNGAFYTWTHTLASQLIHFNNTIGYLSIDPQISELGPFYRNENASYSFDIFNTGLVDVDFTTLLRMEQLNVHVWGGAATLSSLNNNNKSSKSKNTTENRETVLSIAERQKRMIRLDAQQNFVQTDYEHDPDQQYRSNLFQTVSENPGNLPYFEDFEGSDEVPADWLVIDESFGMGSVWHVDDVGTEDSANFALLFGDIETGTYGNNSETYARSPNIDLTDIPDSLQLFLEFDYLGCAWDFWDNVDVWIGIPDENPNAAIEYHLIASTQNRTLRNDSTRHTLVFDLENFRNKPIFIQFGATSTIFDNEGFAWFDNVSLYSTPRDIIITPLAGTVAPGNSEKVRISINTSALQPGLYAVLTSLNYDYEYNTINFFRLGGQITLFTLNNHPPSAKNDTISIVSGDNMGIGDLLNIALANDLDEDNDEIVLDELFDPILGSFKSPGLTPSNDENLPDAYQGWVYVAPLNYDGFDQFQYKINDGFDDAMGTVFMQVLAQPQFIPGMQQEYSFFEDDSLILNTMLLAAGVGGMDTELYVWGETEGDFLELIPDKDQNRLTVKTTGSDTWGQETVTLFVGHGNDILDQVNVTFIVLPVNDYPTALFTYVTDGDSVVFTDTSHDEKDAEGIIVKWVWDFGDGSSSDLQNPKHVYDVVGQYSVRLTVTDKGGLKSSVIEDIDIVTADVLAKQSTIPKDYQLTKNYPNPFNPTTTITFMLPKISDVSLILYDIQGRVVQTIVEDRLQAGEYKVQINGENLTSGVYVVQLNADRISRTQKISLLK